MRGENATIEDADGHLYTDFLGEFTAGIFGHSPPHLRPALLAALEGGILLSSHNGLESELAERLCARFPSMELVRFCNSGTEANLMALTTARACTGRDTILVFEGAYHGSVLTFPAGGSAATAPYKFLLGRYNDVQTTRTLLASQGSDLAAILVEPMLGAGGCMPADAGFLRYLRQVADETGALLIFDEVQTARLSLGGRQAQLGIIPDITVVGKFFGGGLAFGAFGGRRDVMDILDPRRPNALSHAGTFNNNVLAMAAGCAVLRDVLTEPALTQLNARGDRMREALSSLFRNRSAPFAVTGLGSLMNIHPLVESGSAATYRKLLFHDLLEAGLYVAPRGLIALSFPIGDVEIEKFLHAIDAFISRRRALWQIPTSA